MSKIKTSTGLLLAMSITLGSAAIPFSYTMAQTSTSTGTTTSTASSTNTTGGSTGSITGSIVTTSTGTSAPTYTTTSITIVNNLYIGSTGTEVTALQNFLASDPSIYPEGLVTGYFGNLTAKAVRRFQQKYGIAVVGRVGPITRNKINSLMSGGMGGQTTSYGTSPAIFGISSTTATNQDGTRSVTLSWQTDRATRAKVFYGPNLTFTENQSSNSEPYVSGSVISDMTFGTSKTLSISNLQQNSGYQYIIEAIDNNGNVSVTWPMALMTQ